MIVYALSPRVAVIEAAMRAGVGIVPVSDADHLQSLPAIASGIVVENPLDPLQVARSLVGAGVEPADRQCVCVGLGDDSSQTASLVNTALSLAGGRHASFAALELMRNKYRLRQHLGSESRLNGRYWLIDDPSRIADILETTPQGVVVKPLDGSGSRGVARISSPDQVSVLKSGAGLLVEEYFSGSEYSVESLSWDGIHYPLVITEKRIGGKSGVVEIGQRQPARISNEKTECLFAAGAEILTSTGYRYGLSHIEFIVEAGVPKLVEAHGRVGGDMIADLMQWSIGISGFEALFRAYRDNEVSPGAPIGVEAAIEFVDLRGWAGSDDDWLQTVGGVDGVVEARILRGREERSDISSSSDRHAHIVMAGKSVDSIITKISQPGI